MVCVRHVATVQRRIRQGAASASAEGGDVKMQNAKCKMQNTQRVKSVKSEAQFLSSGLAALNGCPGIPQAPPSFMVQRRPKPKRSVPAKFAKQTHPVKPVKPGQTTFLKLDHLDHEHPPHHSTTPSLRHHPILCQLKSLSMNHLHSKVSRSQPRSQSKSK